MKVTAACNQRLHSQYWLTGHKGKDVQDVKMGGGGEVTHTCIWSVDFSCSIKEIAYGYTSW